LVVGIVGVVLEMAALVTVLARGTA